METPTAVSQSPGGERGKLSALLALALLVPIPSIGTTVAMQMQATSGTVGQVVFGLCKIVLLAFPALWLVCVDRGRLSLSRPQRGGFGVAILLGVVISVVIAAAYLLVGRAWIDADVLREAVKRNGIGTPLRYVAFVTFLSLVNSAMEEYVWRWFVFRKCEVMVGAVAAVVLSALLFTVHHVIALRAQFGWDVTLLASAGICVGGAAWSWCYLKYRSIWPGYVSHLIVDATVFVIGWKLIFGGAG